MSNFKTILLIIVLATLLSFSTRNLYAQIGSIGVAIPVEVLEDTQNGHLLCTTQGGLELCRTEYDASMFGVVTALPALALESEDLVGFPLALQKGDALVRVSAANGPITKGDLLTSSEIPGVAQRATLNGFVLGLALEDYQPADPSLEGEILVSINIHPTSAFVGSRSNLISNIRQALSAPTIAPLESLRYLLAFIIAIISFGLGFLYFGRVVKTGVEAIGRNPLATRAIQATVVVNIVITIVIVLAGLAIALLVLIL